jgi:hypothetical protein
MLRRLILAVIAVAALIWSQSPAFSQGVTGGTGGGTGCIPNTSVGNLLVANGTGCAGISLGSSFLIAGGALTSAPGAAAFNIGPLGGDLCGLLPSPNLCVGAASRNVGNLGGALNGTLPSPGLDTATTIAALGAPGGDISGVSFTNMMVSRIQGILVDPTPPTPQTALVYNGSRYTPQSFAPGISQLQGQILAGPGAGLQTATIATNSVTNQQLLNAPAATLKCNATAGMAQENDCSVSGGLAFVGGALQLSPTLGPSITQTISDGTNKFCMLITNGTVSQVSTGQCTTGTLILTADDGATQLTADDAATILTADGSNPTTPCNSGKVAFNVACNAAFFSLFRSVF